MVKKLVFLLVGLMTLAWVLHKAPPVSQPNEVKAKLSINLPAVKFSNTEGEAK